jgi:hypothetical protein
MSEHRFAVALHVLVEPNAMTNPGQDGGQRGLADFERLAAEIVAVELNQIEGVQEHAGVVSAVTDTLEAGYAALVAGDGLPIDDAECERSRAKDATINGKRYVRSLPGRL